MRIFIERYRRNIYYIFLILCQIICICFWGNLKEGFFCDEFFSLEGASNGGVGMQYWDCQPQFYSDWHTHDEFIEYMTVSQEELLLREGG